MILFSALQTNLITWFKNNGRDLPWRQTRNPYHILVSEIMLQQTQVDRVIPKYHAFLATFPTVEALAKATPAEVIQMWQGLGYNRRAINLQRAAQALVAAGYPADAQAFPSTPEELQQLPGIGPYTAGAVACFAFEQPVAFMDTNIRRVIQRLCVGPEATHTKPDSALLPFALQLLPPEQPWIWNQAIMELGATICTAKKPECWRCPLQADCTAYALWSQADSMIDMQPVQRPKPKAAERPFHTTNRYFRGKIVDILRTMPAQQAVSLEDLGQQLKDDWDHEHLAWLTKLVAGLINDGLVVWVTQTTSDTQLWTVSLPYN